MAYKKSGFKLKEFPITEGTTKHKSALRSQINLDAILAGAEAAHDEPDTTAATTAAWNKVSDALISKASSDKGTEDPNAPKKKKTLSSTLTGIEDKIKTGLGNIKQFFQ